MREKFRHLCACNVMSHFLQAFDFAWSISCEICSFFLCQAGLCCETYPRHFTLQLSLFHLANNRCLITHMICRNYAKLICFVQYLQFPYYEFVDRASMYKVGSLFYAIYFIVSFPMFLRWELYVPNTYFLGSWPLYFEKCMIQQQPGHITVAQSCEEW